MPNVTLALLTFEACLFGLLDGGECSELVELIMVETSDIPD